MECRYCKKNIRDNSKLCPFCGNEIKNSNKATLLRQSPEPVKKEITDKKLKEFYARVAQLVLEGEVPKSVIEDELVNQGWNKFDAQEFIKKVKYEISTGKKYQTSLESIKLADRYKNTMIGGAIAIVLGTIITLVSINVAESTGGTYACCWGAIIFGIISFFSGLIGWLRYRKRANK